MAHDAAMLDVNLASVFAAYREQDPHALEFAWCVVERVSRTRAEENRQHKAEMAKIKRQSGS